MAKFIGGDLPFNETKKFVLKHLRPLKPKNLKSYLRQCPCGSFEFVQYRKRFYCYRCGMRIGSPDRKYFHKETFREAFEGNKR